MEPLIQQATNNIKFILEQIGLNQFISSDPHVYVGGSLPSYVLSQTRSGKSFVEKPNDIDLYTTDHNYTITLFNRHFQDFRILEICGSIINFIPIKNQTQYKVQFITAEVDNFCDEVLDNYDCDMVSVGYHPHSQTFIFNHRYLEAINEKNVFTCDVRRSDETRQVKLTRRANEWYGMKVNFVGICQTHGTFNHECYQARPDCSQESVLYNINPPKYLQLFHHLYKCIRCHHVISQDLICSQCKQNVMQYQITNKMTITILGGLNGFGHIMAETYEKLGHIVYKTSRFSQDEGSTKKFELNQRISDALFQCIDQSDLLILNATKTLENDESVWNTTIDHFDFDLLVDRIQTNVLGYVRLVQELFHHRLEQKNSKSLIVVYVDANESKYDGKMIDGKHLELNIAKSAVKQIFYTNANIFTKLNMSILCYDPGWMSYHGVSIEKKRSNSQHLISPIVAAYGLLWNIEQEHTGIVDCSVYDYLTKSIMT